MYVITGASGNTGSVVAHKLLDHGSQVRVIGRSLDRLRQFTERGAEAITGDLSDSATMIRAFQGATAVYVVLPQNPAEPDVYASDERIISSLTSALSVNRVRFAVVLSSLGAERLSGTGSVLGLHRLEEAINRIEGVNSLHLRAGSFMENTLVQAGIIANIGIAAGPYRADLKLPMIASRDIAAVAAEELLQLDFQGHQTRELLGQRDISYNEVAAIIGKAIGKPDMTYQQLPDQQLRPELAKFGMSPNFIDLYMEMCASLNAGEMQALEPRNARNTTPTSYEAFVAEQLRPVLVS
jgi:uncharacterized protein YbjT (DUF2867 family)